MKVKVKATNEIVEIIDFISESKDSKMPKFVDQYGREYNFYELEFSKQNKKLMPDWESIRTEAAIAAMQGCIIANKAVDANKAVECADALVKELQKKYQKPEQASRCEGKQASMPDWKQTSTQQAKQNSEESRGSLKTFMAKNWIDIKEFEPSEQFCSMYDCLKDKFLVRGILKGLNTEFIRTGEYLGNGRFSCFDSPIIVTHWKPIIVSIK